MKKIIILLFLSLALPTSSWVAWAQASKGFTLVLDAGHGGKDPGALGKTGKEKNINLAVALAVGKLVEQNMKDVKVVYTRKTDIFVELNERADIANRAKADLFVSIHTNALPGKAQGRGSETYTLGMHRAADNLAVAKRENAAIMLRKTMRTAMRASTPRAPSHTSSSSSCRTPTWNRA